MRGETCLFSVFKQQFSPMQLTPWSKIYAAFSELDGHSLKEFQKRSTKMRFVFQGQRKRIKETLLTLIKKKNLSCPVSRTVFLVFLTEQQIFV